ncbi:hypothetical protein [Streptococcus gordonii]|uniref:hypothetical protein n=1 Tax=Streptococcus gordonii TaxID=1302 RepID=UPI002001516F|nr:hypothetical protein [Streptococcus gordonii]
MKLKIHRKESQYRDYYYVYLISGNFYGSNYCSEIYDNFVVIDNFEDFAYWFEQQIYYLTLDQFEKIDGMWLRMMYQNYKERDQLPF